MLQIQPEFVDGNKYLTTAIKHELTFEVLELSMPGGANADAVEWYKKCGKVTSLHGAFVDVNPASNDALIRDASIKRCEESLRLASALGAKNVVFHSSCFPFLRGKYLDAWAQKSAEYYVSAADRYGVDVFVENSFDLDPTPLSELVKRANNKRVRACLDIGHASYSRTPLEEWFAALDGFIGYIHISDNDGLFDDHKTLGEGTVDLALASRLSSSIGDIPTTLEVRGVDAIERSVDYLKSRSLFGM